MAQFQFSTAGIEPAEAPQERLPLPEGKYNAVITDSEMRTTKAGTGHYLNFTWEITSGEHRGRKVWANYNVDNPNEKAVEIAKRDLASVCTAMGKDGFEDSQDLHFHEIEVLVKIREASNGYPASNEIRGYSAPAGSAPPPPAAPVAQAAPVAEPPAPAPAPAADAGKKPWDK